MERLDIVQPALFATMVALARLWEACGVKPSIVIGHSQGEVAAAHIAGGLSLDDAARIIALRSKAMAKIAGKGAMASVSLPVRRARRADRALRRAHLPRRDQRPGRPALSGEPEAIEELLSDLRGAGHQGQADRRRLRRPLRPDRGAARGAAGGLRPDRAPQPEVALHSTLTGEPIDTAEMDASYWYRNLRETVLFNPVVEQLLEAGRSHFVEISPHPVLSFGISEAIEAAEADAHIVGTLRREEDPAQRFCLSLAEAHVGGVAVEWERFFAGTGAKRVPLPTYPFQRKRYWLAGGSAVADPASAGQAPAEHPLLGAVVSLAGREETVLTGRLSLPPTPGWRTTPSPARSCSPAPPSWSWRCTRPSGSAPSGRGADPAGAPRPARGGRRVVQISVASPDPQGRRALQVHSRPAGDEEAPWALNAEGALASEASAMRGALDPWPPAEAESLQTEFLYDLLAEAGVEYGPAFQALSRAWKLGERSSPRSRSARSPAGRRPAASSSTRRCSTPRCRRSCSAGCRDTEPAW